MRGGDTEQHPFPRGQAWLDPRPGANRWTASPEALLEVEVLEKSALLMGMARGAAALGASNLL